MKKTLNINLNSIAFIIDEDAYQVLHTYLYEVSKQFSTEEDKEIMKDIEARIAELFSEKLQPGKNVIELDDVNNVIEVLGHPSQYHEEGDASSEKTETKKKRFFDRRLYRDPDNRRLGGVAAGIAAYFGIDVTLVRILLVILVVPLSVGMIIPLYFVMWLITPLAETQAQKLEMKGEPVTIDSLKNSYEDIKKKSSHNLIDAIFSIIRFLIKGIAVFVGVIATITIVSVIIALLGSLVAVLVVPHEINIMGFEMTDLSGLGKIYLTVVILSLLGCIVCPLAGVIMLVNYIRKRKKSKALWAMLILWVISIMTLFTSSLFLYKEVGHLPANMNKVTTEVRVPAFHSIKAENTVNVKLIQGDSCKVFIKANEKYIGNVQTEVVNGVLNIKNTKNIFTNATVQVVAPDIRKISLKDASSLESDYILSYPRVDIDVTDASKLELNLVTEEISVSVSDASKAEIRGSAETAYFNLQGVSKIDAEKFCVKNAHVNAHEVSKIETCAKDSIWLSAHGNSKIEYYDNPVIVKQELSELSRVKKD